MNRVGVEEKIYKKHLGTKDDEYPTNEKKKYLASRETIDFWMVSLKGSLNTIYAPSKVPLVIILPHAQQQTGSETSLFSSF